MRTGDVLRKRGIQVSEEQFAALLDDALTGDSAAHAPDPRRVLTEAEARVLAGGGADLAPQRSGETAPAIGKTAPHAGETAPHAGETAPGAEAAAALGALLVDSLTVASAARRLGVDASRIRHRLIKGTLYGIRLRSGWRLPAFQFAGTDGLVPGVEDVLAALPRDLHPVAVQRWLSTPVQDLSIDDTPQSPLAWLRGGGAPQPVTALAAAL